MKKVKLYSSLTPIKIKLFIDGSFQDDIDSVDTLSAQLEDVDEDSEVLLTLNNVKSSSGELVIFNLDSFIQNIKVVEKCNLWDKIFNTFDSLVYLNDINLKHSLNFTKLSLCSVSSLNKFNQIDDKPNYYSLMASKASNALLKNELKIISSFYFLKNVCSAYDFETSESFEFEGFRNFIIPNVDISDLFNHP